MTRLLLAPDSFKGTLTADEVCSLWAAALDPPFDCVSHPLADGGEGTLTALYRVLGGQWQTVLVQGPLPHQTVEARYLWFPATHTAIIEMAAASGLPLVPLSQRNPEITTSYGTGQLLRHAQHQGATHIYLAIGGSATQDGGLGLLMALGWQFLDHTGRSVGWGGQALGRVETIVRPLEPFGPAVTVLGDVTNPLCGPQGTAQVYAPQKGADAEMVQRLETGIRHWAQRVQDQFQVDLNFPGSGAAGGVGGAVVWALNARWQGGLTAIAELTQLDHALQTCDGVITGEGCFDGQSLQGKVVGGVIKRAQIFKKPVFVVAGQIKPIDKNVLPPTVHLVSVVEGGVTPTQSLANPQETLKMAMQRLKPQLLTHFPLP